MAEIPSQFKLTGGPLSEEQTAALHRLKNLIEREADVHRVRALQPDPDPQHAGKWLYLIETPFATYPKFAVGRTDEVLGDVKILSLHSADWGAWCSWEALTVIKP